MDRSLSASQQAEFERWTSTVDFVSDAEANEFLIAFKLAQTLGRPSMSVLRASRGNKGFKDLEASVLLEVARDRTIEHWMDGRVRRLRFAALGLSRPIARVAVPLDVAADICGCTAAELIGYRVRAMPGHSEMGLGDDEYDPLEVIAIYIAVGLKACRYSQDRIDLFVVRLLSAPPTDEEWAVDVTPRSGKLEVVPEAAVGELGSRRNMRWLRPDGAYSALRDLGYTQSALASTVDPPANPTDISDVTPQRHGQGETDGSRDPAAVAVHSSDGRTCRSGGGGHLFVASGDVTRLHCDAWLLPTDDWMSTAGDFTTVIKAAEAQKAIGPWADDEQFRALPTSDAADPQVWLGRIGGLDQPASWYADCAEQFIAAAAASAHLRGASGRAVPLLAMPVLGTRYGGGRWDEKGQILEALIERISRAARDHDADVVLVTWGEDAERSQAMYAAAQRARQRVLAANPSVAGWDLGPNAPALEDAAVRLAALARSGRLVLFLGAGVSAGAGLPTWQHLIDELARAADLDEDAIESLHRFDLRDQATIVMQDSDDGRDQIVQALDTAHYPLTGALLASLPTTEAITTNYDGLFEAAVEACHQDLVVLPYSSVSKAGQRWLLKLHGSVGRSGVDIVLTRDDYLAAPSSHAALFGLVQAMLLTRHMLFVGYSLGDEDFHKIVHEVRTAQASASEAGRSVLGSALVLGDDPLQAKLWSGTISVVPVVPRSTGGGAGDAQSVAVAARRLQVFLDRVAFLAADMTGFLLDADFAGLLNESERKVAEGLANLAGLTAGDAALDEKLTDLLRPFGG